MYKIKMLLIFISLVLIFGNANAYTNEFPLIGKVIYLDAGHGGKDPGAYYKDIYEEDINLSITQKLKYELEKLGAIVYMTREDDYDLSSPNAYLRKKSDLSNRANMINLSNADIYLSIHLNSSINENWKGAQVFYDDVNEQNKEIAEIIQKQFNKKLNSKRNVKEISELYMYKNVNIPGVLLELGFISNTYERGLLITDNYQNKVVDVICSSILDIFN